MPDKPLKKADNTMADKNQRVPADPTIIDEDERIVVHANYELFVLFLSAFQVVNSILIVLLRGDSAHPIPVAVNYGISLYLIVDFIVRLLRSRDRRRFLFKFHGYLLFIGSLPFPFAGLFRLFAYGLVIRRLRRADYTMMQRIILRKEAQSAMLVTFVAAVIVLEVSSIFILELESQSPEANIQGASDAMWWALVTMATVGYGDNFPVTTEGRLIAVIVMVVGVGIFTVLTSFLAQFFLRPRHGQDEEQEDKRGRGESPQPEDPQSSISQIKALIDHQEAARAASEADHAAAMAELRNRLDHLEEQLNR